jgi:hypothetical protein
MNWRIPQYIASIFTYTHKTSLLKRFRTALLYQKDQVRLRFEKTEGLFFCQWFPKLNWETVTDYESRISYYTTSLTNWKIKLENSPVGVQNPVGEMPQKLATLGPEEIFERMTNVLLTKWYEAGKI